MGKFRIDMLTSHEDSEAEFAFEVIQRGTEEERQRALEKLIERAHETETVDDWNAMGVGYLLANHKGQALEVFDLLVDQCPENPVYRINLAAAHERLGNAELCRHHLGVVAEFAGDTRYREKAQEYLERYTQRLGICDKDEQLRVLQRDALIARIETGTPSATDYYKLGRLLAREGMMKGIAHVMESGVEYLERGAAAFPEDVKILELLVPNYLRHDPEGKLDGVLKRLEKIAPDSQVLDVLRENKDQPNREYFDDMHTRVEQLMRDVAEGDGDERALALAELQRITVMAPDNDNYRLHYAFALCVADHSEAALEQADIVAPRARPEHSVHFNLGQIYKIVGEPERSRRHFELALKYAETEQDRRDVYEQLESLEH